MGLSFILHPETWSRSAVRRVRHRFVLFVASWFNLFSR
jgi:hypothetical protein